MSNNPEIPRSMVRSVTRSVLENWMISLKCRPFGIITSFRSLEPNNRSISNGEFSENGVPLVSLQIYVVVKRCKLIKSTKIYGNLVHHNTGSFGTEAIITTAENKQTSFRKAMISGKIDCRGFQ